MSNLTLHLRYQLVLYFHKGSNRLVTDWQKQGSLLKYKTIFFTYVRCNDSKLEKQPLFTKN